MQDDGRALEEFIIHSPVACDLQILLVFYQLLFSCLCYMQTSYEMVSNVHVHQLTVSLKTMNWQKITRQRTTITLKFKMCWFQNKARY